MMFREIGGMLLGTAALILLVSTAIAVQLSREEGDHFQGRKLREKVLVATGLKRTREPRGLLGSDTNTPPVDERRLCRKELQAYKAWLI